MADQTKVLLALATERLQGPMGQVDLDRERKEVSCGFRHGDEVYVAGVKWKRVKYSGKASYHFEMEVFSLSTQETIKVPLERILPGGLGKKRLISLPALKLEASHKFKQGV